MTVGGWKFTECPCKYTGGADFNAIGDLTRKQRSTEQSVVNPPSLKNERIAGQTRNDVKREHN